uniref:Uncharacterized protein n=1 Tax=Bubo bubo TaxID=30461 RepID=A0A8C0FAF8_BUBBB
MFPLRCLDLLWATRRVTCWLSPHLLPCQSLPKILLFQLLGLSIATLSTVTHYGLHFTLISNISLANNSYRVIHHAGTSRLHPSESAGVAKSPKAIEGNAEVLREETGVEDSMMDVYDLVYEEVRRNTSSFRRHELTAIHEAVSCLSALAENLALGYLPNGFGRLKLMPVLCLMDVAMPFSIRTESSSLLSSLFLPSYSSFSRFDPPDYQQEERDTYLSITLMQDLQSFCAVADIYVVCLSRPSAVLPICGVRKWVYTSLVSRVR